MFRSGYDVVGYALRSCEHGCYDFFLIYTFSNKEVDVDFPNTSKSNNKDSCTSGIPAYLQHLPICLQFVFLMSSKGICVASWIYHVIVAHRPSFCAGIFH